MGEEYITIVAVVFLSGALACSGWAMERRTGIVEVGWKSRTEGLQNDTLGRYAD